MGSSVTSAILVISSLSGLTNYSPESLLIVSKSSFKWKKIRKPSEGFFQFLDCLICILAILPEFAKSQLMRLGSRWQVTVGFPTVNSLDLE